jgi:hypothetical protein
MTKRVIDLTAKELDRMAREAGDAAVQEALAKGLPVTGSYRGRRFRRHPDGKMEDLGPVATLADQEAEVPQGKKPRHSAA